MNDHQRFLIRQSWQHIEYLEKLITEIEERVDSLLQNYEEELQLLMSIPGVKKDTSAIIIAEIGVDMSQFPKKKKTRAFPFIFS